MCGDLVVDGLCCCCWFWLVGLVDWLVVFAAVVVVVGGGGGGGVCVCRGWGGLLFCFVSLLFLSLLCFASYSLTGHHRCKADCLCGPLCVGALFPCMVICFLCFFHF